MRTRRFVFWFKLGILGMVLATANNVAVYAGWIEPAGGIPVVGHSAGPAGVTPAGAATACGAEGMVAILNTIKSLESGDYSKGYNGGGATGAYQFVDGTWNGYGGYSSSYLAPPSVQDAKATEHVNQWLGAGGVEMVPVGWYIGHIPEPGSAEWDTVPAPWAGNINTPRQYQTMWMDKYRQQPATCQGAPS